MDKQINTSASMDETARHLPLGHLFYMLHSNGFKVKPDDYIEMLKVTERFGSHNIDQTAKWICPIVATSEMEQARFYNIIEQYKKLTAAQYLENTDAGKPVLRWLKIVSFSILAALLLLTIFLSLRGKARLLEEADKERSVEKEELLSFDASGLLRDNPADTAHIQFAWQFEDSSRQQGLRVSHTFKKPGDYFVKRQFSSSGIRLQKKEDTLIVHVCNDLPKININIPEEALALRQPVTITAGVDAEPGTISYFQWKINDTVFTTTTPVVQNFIFYKEGDYTVECKAVVGEINSPCTATDNKIIQVLDKGLHYNGIFSAGKPSSYTAQTTPKWWFTLVLLLPAAAGLLYSLFKRKHKRATAKAKPAAEPAVAKGSYEIPFEQNDVKLVQQETELRRTFIQMCYKAEEETLALNVSGTIGSTIRSGGIPQLVFAPVTRQQQYLILIDRANPKSMLTQFFSWLVKTMDYDCIPVMVYYYDKNFVCYNSQFPSGQSLQRLAETQSNATLLIFGKAHELVYGVYPVIEEKFLRELHRWQSKAIVTPVPVKDWASKEKVLQENIILVPADVMALQKLIPALKEKIKVHESLLRITETDQYGIRNIDFRDVTELQRYLNNDAALFQWLCAICIYPRLRWEVMIEIGKAILDKYGRPEDLNYTSLLKLCRIDWMQQGVFPQATRFELLKLLTTDNEICARETLLRMLNYSTLLYGQDRHRFEEEKKRQQLTNQFILHASDNIRYSRYAGSKEAFQQLWKNDTILDVPLKKYLDKTSNDNWETPVNNGKSSVGLSQYFSLPDVKPNTNIRFRRALVGIGSFFLIVFWAYIGFFGGAARFEPMISLGQLKNEPLVPLEMKLLKNFAHCGDSLEKTFEKIDGYLEIGDERTALFYSQKTSVVSFNVPYKSYMEGRGQMVFSWENNKSVVLPFNFKDRVPDSVTISCLSINRLPLLYLRYNDTAGYRDIENELVRTLFGSRLSVEQVDFQDSSRIIYYEENQKPRADSIVSVIKQSLGIDVKEEFVYEKREPPASPMLFLNTAHKPNPSNDYNAADNKAAADDYHRMADQDFADKKYMQAIAGYARALALNANDALAHYQRGVCYEMLGDSYTNQALEEYTAAIRLDGKDEKAWYRRASIKYGLKRYTDAIGDYNRVIALNSADAKKQTSYSVYYRGKSYYFLNYLSSACQDFKRAGELGVAAGEQDYQKYCSGGEIKPDCDKVFYSLKEVLSVDARVVCKLDLSKENLTSLPAELYNFKNLTQLNLGTTAIPVAGINQLQKTLINCKISYSVQAKQPETDLGFINLDEKGYPDEAGLQLIEQVGKELRRQPNGTIRLEAEYGKSYDQKTIRGYIGDVMKMFEPYMTNPKAAANQRMMPVQQAQQQNATPERSNRIRLHVWGVNFNETPAQAY